MLGDIAVADLSSSALLGIVVLLILSGRLVPRSTLKDKAAESERWRDAYEKEREGRQLSDAQTAELLEITRTTRDYIAAVAFTSERLRRSGGIDEISTT